MELAKPVCLLKNLTACLFTTYGSLGAGTLFCAGGGYGLNCHPAPTVHLVTTGCWTVCAGKGFFPITVPVHDVWELSWNQNTGLCLCVLVVTVIRPKQVSEEFFHGADPVLVLIRPLHFLSFPATSSEKECSA